jgi:hypothetical protein
MKSQFAQDYSTWQQTIRTAVNLPAYAEEPTPAQPAPTSPGGTSPGLSLLRQRLPVALGAGAIFVALVALMVLVFRKPEPAAAPPPLPAVARPTIEPPLLPLPPGPVAAPGPWTDPEPGAPPFARPAPGATDPTAVSRATRRKTSAPARAAPPPTRPRSGGSDRRPNPF